MWRLLPFAPVGTSVLAGQQAEGPSCSAFLQAQLPRGCHSLFMEPGFTASQFPQQRWHSNGRRWPTWCTSFTIGHHGSLQHPAFEHELLGVAGHCRSWRAGRLPLELSKRSRLTAPNARHTVPSPVSGASTGCRRRSAQQPLLHCCRCQICCDPGRFESLGSVDWCRSVNIGWCGSSCNTGVCMYTLHALPRNRQSCLAID